MSIIEPKYFRVDLEYLQRSSAFVAAKDADNAKAMVEANTLEGIEQFKINEVHELSEEEAAGIIRQLSGLPDPEDMEQVSTEDKRTLN